MKTGIVILNYNSYELTCNLATKCMKNSSIDKVVIVDNNSNDNFDDFVRNKKKVHYIKNENNSGYAAGNNLGLKYLFNNDYKIGIIANPDVDFDGRTIANIVNKFQETNFKYPIISCSRYLNGSRATGQFWWIPTYFSSLVESTYLGRKFLDKRCVRKTNNIIENETSDCLEVEVVGGAFFACDLAFMNEINYLDEGTFLWYEENILAYKVRAKNKKELLLLNSSYEHNHKKTTKKNYKLKIFMNSKHYYMKEILKINFFQLMALKVFELIGLFEQFVVNIIYTILGK